MQLQVISLLVCLVKCEKHLNATIDFTGAKLNADGSKECVNTTSTIEVFEKIPVQDCIHKEEELCHYTYITQFLPTREEECEIHYEKSCKVTIFKHGCALAPALLANCKLGKY